MINMLYHIKRLSRLRRHITFIFSFGSLIFLFATIRYFYNYLRSIPYPYSTYEPETFLAFAIGLSICAFEDRIFRRIIGSAVVALVGCILSSTFRLFMIFCVFTTASMIGGFGRINISAPKLLFYKTIRTLIVVVALMVAYSLPFRHGSNDSSSFTAYQNAFLAVVFLPIVSAIIFDSLVYRIERKMGELTRGPR